MALKVVADSNVLVSAFVWRGNPRRLLDDGLAAGWQFYSSELLLAELERVLSYPRIATAIARQRQTPSALFELAQGVLRPVNTTPLVVPVCRDPDDDEVLACAMAAKADLIVSGDADLLILGQYQGIPIITTAQALVRQQEEQGRGTRPNAT